MKRAAALLAVVLLGAPDVSAKAAPDAVDGVRKLCAAVKARQGLRYRSLIVVPLVLRGDSPGAGPSVTTEGLTWSAKAKKGGDVPVALRSTAKKGAPTLLPSGFILRADHAEMLLAHPALVPCGPDAQVLSRARALHDVPADAKHTLDRVAPPEFRHALRASTDTKSLAHLLMIQAVLSGRDPDKPVSLKDLRAASPLTKRIAEARKVLSPLGTSYGGQAVGYVAIRGRRVIEAVVCRSPRTFAAYWTHAVTGLAHSVAYYEELHSLAKQPVRDVAWLPCLDAAHRTLYRLPYVRVKREKLPKGARGFLWRVGVRKPRRANVGGWYLADDNGAPVVLELWGGIALNPLRAPKRDEETPEAPSVPASPDPEDDDSDGEYGPDVSGGAMTVEALERILERLKERRAEIERRARQKR